MQDAGCTRDCQLDRFALEEAVGFRDRLAIGFGDDIVGAQPSRVEIVGRVDIQHLYEVIAITQADHGGVEVRFDIGARMRTPPWVTPLALVFYKRLDDHFAVATQNDDAQFVADAQVGYSGIGLRDAADAVAINFPRFHRRDRSQLPQLANQHKAPMTSRMVAALPNEETDARQVQRHGIVGVV